MDAETRELVRIGSPRLGGLIAGRNTGFSRAR